MLVLDLIPKIEKHHHFNQFDHFENNWIEASLAELCHVSHNNRTVLLRDKAGAPVSFFTL